MIRPSVPRGASLPALALLLLLGAAPSSGPTPSDPGFPWQWGLENRGQPVRPGSDEHGTRDSDIDGLEVFASGHSGEGIVLALIGHGFRYRGSSLEPVLWRNVGEIPGNGIDDDGNRFVDDVVGYDFGEHDPDPSFPGAHDRLVAEIAVAPHDGSGIAGIAPGARLMILKVTGEDEGLISPALFRALRYAVQHGARVLFLPWTLRGQDCDTPSLSPLAEVFAEAARTAFIVGGHPADWPACLPSVVAVQATDAHDLPKAGRHAAIELSAPGSDGRTPVAVSFAIGFVAGAAALLLAQEPDRTPMEVRTILGRTADRVHPELAPYWDGWNDLFGRGRINLARALGTDLDGDGLLDSDDPDADGDGVPEPDDPCPLDPRPDCGGPLPEPAEADPLDSEE